MTDLPAVAGKSANGLVRRGPETAAPVERLLNAAGLPSEDLPPQDAHRIALGVLEAHFALTLPRTRILEAPLPRRRPGDRLIAPSPWRPPDRAVVTR
ncbi:hypothetical protein [Streptomyces sp. NPDC001933]|uniref:hypothetical protein n=1 Tax=Streptomyces sp. NPDC001933 TaxID=3364626 RepID=UPI0036ACD480